VCVCVYSCVCACVPVCVCSCASVWCGAVGVFRLLAEVIPVVVDF